MKEQIVKKIFRAFGTINSITIPGDCSVDILEYVKQRMLQMHNRFSFFDPNSEISQINQKAGVHPVPVSKDTISLLSLSLDYARDTKESFDVTVGAVNELWKDAIRQEKLPLEAQINHCKKLCGIQNLELDTIHETAFLRKKGMKLDLGGIVKGYAADETCRILQGYGIQNAKINFGGTVVIMGKKQKIGIQHPFKQTGGTMAHVILENKAIVTSGSYEQCFFYQGKRFHHIIDPHTGKPTCSGLLSVTLIGDEAAKLDAFATGICCLGLKNGALIAQQHGISAIFVTENGCVQITPELQTHLSFYS